MSRRQALAGGALALALLALAPAACSAAGPPILNATWTSAVGTGSARLSAAIDPNGSATFYHFEYTTTTDFTACGTQANPACLKAPPKDASLPAVGGPPAVSAPLFSLTPATTYRYRVVAANGSGPATPPPVHTFTTFALPTGSLLPDNRGWEMVSPVQKNGGQADLPESIAKGGLLQAAAQGGSVTYSSAASFEGGQGAPPLSQYMASRGSGGWSTQNLTVPIFSGSYDAAQGGAPYRLFSPDLARGLLLNGKSCRGEATSGCPVANPTLPGTDAPAGYQDYYLREGTGFEALLGAGDLASLAQAPADFELGLAGASPDLRHVVLSSCSRLTAAATDGCGGAEENLYEWSAAKGLSLLSGAPGASLAAPLGAVSEDGSRVYFYATGDLYLHDATGNHLIAMGAEFQAATPDGALAYYLASGDLFAYAATTHSHGPALASGVVGVLGISASGDDVYFQDGSGLKRRHLATTTQIAPGANAADPSDWPPATGTARVSADGTKLLFVSSSSLTGYDNTDLLSGKLDSQVFLYDASGAGALSCLSCNPTGGRPIGPSTIPGAIANGSGPTAALTYKPRVLSADGGRVFFDSADALVLTDTNTKGQSAIGVSDAYQWEAQGEGSCAKAGGCVSLLSTGRSLGGARFIDASADGSDAFFITDASLIEADPGALDLYDARVGGGFPVPAPPIPCEGDACQSLPPAPKDPTLTTLLRGAGNPAVRYAKHCRRGTVKRKGHCVAKQPSRKKGGRR